MSETHKDALRFDFDQKEFFAEMTESYLGMNDFFPFNRAELMTEEPEIFQLLLTIWGAVSATAKVEEVVL